MSTAIARQARTMLKGLVKNMTRRAPLLRTVIDERDQLRAELSVYQLGWLPGHFYSPIPSLQDIRQRETNIFTVPSSIAGVDLNEDVQLQLLDELLVYYPDQPFVANKREHLRFFWDNPNYVAGEAILLYSMMRHLRPRRIVEVGSGYSSCVMLDTNQLFLDNAVSITCVEPYPQLLRSLIKPGDEPSLNILDHNLQDTDLDLFTSLEANDILFIDSTHVAKVGSDVNYIFSTILPSLAHGVYIHFHDIFYPFEYPKQWIYQGRSWNEIYVLRAFLQYNAVFTIQLFNSFLGHVHRDRYMLRAPLIMNEPGASIWLKKAA